MAVPAKPQLRVHKGTREGDPVDVRVRYNMRVEIAGGTAELCGKRNGLELAELGLEALTVHLKVFAEVGGKTERAYGNVTE